MNNENRREKERERKENTFNQSISRQQSSSNAVNLEKFFRSLNYLSASSETNEALSTLNY